MSSTTTLSRQEHALGRDIAKVSRQLDELERRRDGVDAELEACSGQRHQFRLLGTILLSLDELEAAGGAELFWNRAVTGHSPELQLQKAREHSGAFDARISAIEDRRAGIQSEIDTETVTLRHLNSQLAELEEELEAAHEDFVAHRDASEIPYRPLLMPWATDPEEGKRQRKVLFACLFIAVGISSLVLFLKPTHEVKQEEFIPEHIAELVVKKKEEPKPEPKKQKEPSDQPSNQPQQPNKQQPVADPNAPPAPPGSDESKQQARASAQTKGVLAQSGAFADMIGGDTGNEPVKMGAEGAVSTTGTVAAGQAATRALITSQVGGGGSGGINTAAISRNGPGGGTGRGGNGTGGGGSSITGNGMKVAKVESSTGAATAAARPLSSGAAASRTDEEIQIVFDKYKSALYRIYNRELRNDPTLKGKMVLRLTIEPDGHVSACAVKSTDLASPALSADVVERVLKFNFGAKQGVPAVTISYPIDFLPAS